MSINPYEPPTIPAEVLEPEWPCGGCYRDGKYLVMHHASALPPICVRTGRPAETEQEHELTGGLPNDGSVPAARKRWYGDKVYLIRVPLSKRAVRQGELLEIAGIVTASLMLLALFSLAWFYRLGKNDVGNYILVAALIGLIVSVGLLSEARQKLQLECVARGYFWISNAPARYLKLLPEWPVPRPGFWRRTFFGPAGVSGPAKPASPQA